jgi:hypothetical protein
MRLVELFAKWLSVLAPNLVRWLEAGKAAFPDEAEEIDGVLAKLGTAVSPQNVAAKVTEILAEGGDIVQFKFKGTSHPHDVA